MIVIQSPTVNEALQMGLNVLLEQGYVEKTRNGEALVAPTTVSNEYLYPKMRVLFSEARDANPFFHLVEAMWMLAGRKDVACLKRFAANIATYSVDGDTLHAAYGDRWINLFGFDQITAVIKKLRSQINTRQAVLQIWSAEDDLRDSEANAKDRACNLTVVFTARLVKDDPSVSGKYVLDMQVFNRSNDAVWGCYGANYVHFSFLLSFVAEAVGLEVGRYTQISSNFHMYSREMYGEKLYDAMILNTPDMIGLKPEFASMLQADGKNVGAYSNHYLRGVTHLNHTFFSVDNDTSEEEIVEAISQFRKEANTVLDFHFDRVDDLSESCYLGITHPFLVSVVMPMMEAHNAFKSKDYKGALSILEEADFMIAEEWEDELFCVQANSDLPTGSPCKYDWFHAAWLWIDRRNKAFLNSKANNPTDKP